MNFKWAAEFWAVTHTSLAMESNSHEQYSSKSSSEQIDGSDSEQTDDVNYMVNGDRFYECVFCKRGFATAQGLGGHMNIHRKDRAKTKRSLVLTSSSSKPSEEYFKFKSYPSISTNLLSRYYVTASDQVHTYYQDFFSPSISFHFKRLSRPKYSPDLFEQNQWDFNLFGEDWGRNFSHIDDDKGKMEAGREDNDLDLELRLGYYP